jgi:hypothetical protein
MGHHVNFPDPLPIAIRRALIAFDDDARVGTEQVDMPELFECLVYQALHVGFESDIDARIAAPELGRDLAGRLMFQVRDHYRARPLGGKVPAQRAPNPIPASGHDDDLVL